MRNGSPAYAYACVGRDVGEPLAKSRYMGMPHALNSALIPGVSVYVPVSYVCVGYGKVYDMLCRCRTVLAASGLQSCVRMCFFVSCSL